MFLAPPSRLLAGTVGIAAAATLLGMLVTVPASADTATPPPLPQITSLSAHRGTTDCGTEVTITGQNFVGVSDVLFGPVEADVQAVSPGQIVVWVPAHAKRAAVVRVVTAAGTSAGNSQTRFAWIHPRLSMRTTKLNCGMTAVQAIANSNKYRRHAARYLAVPTVRRTRQWRPAMGVNAVQRAEAWTGLSYSFAAGSASGPTYGVKSEGGGWFDNKVWGFDCSGLALYAWAPYKGLAHFAATQFRGRAGSTPARAS